MKELSPDPTSTYGATEEYKAAWNAKYGLVAPAKSASKSDWVEFVSTNGLLSEEEAESRTRDELAEEFGGEAALAAPSVPNDTRAPAGEGASPSLADPMK